ncbi:MAG: PKD domain-containing protein, partial [Candidatus Pacearchaeota archaeon]
MQNMQNQKGSKKRQSGKGQGSLGYALKALAAFLAILIVGIMQLSFSFAFDLAPTITLAETSHDPSLSQSILVANAFDPGDNSGLRWIKLFEDGSLKYEKNCAGSSTCTLTAIITHSTAGWHSFYAKTQDKSGKTATSQTLRIYFEGANQPPQITSKNPSQNTFSISEASLSQSFSITASDPNGDSISYSWYVNNQQQSSSGNSFIWQVPNVDSNEVFNIAVIVSDGKASSGAGWSATVTDTAPENVDFSFSPSSPSVGQLVNFVASATAFDGISGFSWDFGDGSTASGQSVSHAYAVRGTYTVTLTARDADGDERSRTKTIIVRDTAAPQVIIYSPQDGATYDSLPIQLEYSVSDDDGIAACWYVL